MTPAGEKFTSSSVERTTSCCGAAMLRAIGRSAPYGLGALALILTAPLACAPAAACPQTQVAEATVPAAPQAARPKPELKFDWPVRGRIV